MSLKSIRESYSKLLDVFGNAGVMLNESQKSDLDTFVLALESKMGEQRRSAIRQTKKAVEKKMEREYRKVFESVMAGMRENALLASKIQDKVTKINESKKIASKVNDYLDLYVESVLPKKSIVDYDRMQKLEKLQESLKDVLLVSEDSVEAKIKQLEESYKTKQSKCETEVAKIQVKLNEEMAKSRKMKGRLNKYKAMELLESKTKNLPSYEARRVKRALAEATVQEIESKFGRILESVRKHLKEAKAEDEETLESEIKKILDCDDVAEDDMLRNRPHNGHKSVMEDEEDVEEDDMLRDRPHNGHKSVREAELSQDDLDDIAEITGNFYKSSDNMGGLNQINRDSMRKQDAERKLVRSQNPEDFTANEGEEDFETMEEVKMNERGEVQLDESDIIDRNLMKMWCNRSVVIE